MKYSFRTKSGYIHDVIRAISLPQPKNEKSVVRICERTDCKYDYHIHDSRDWRLNVKYLTSDILCILINVPQALHNSLWLSWINTAPCTVLGPIHTYPDFKVYIEYYLIYDEILFLFQITTGFGVILESLCFAVLLWLFIEAPLSNLTNLVLTP